MLPLKWKIFRLLNYVHLFFSTGFLIILLWGIVSVLSSTRVQNEPAIFVVSFCFLWLALNAYLNLHILGKYFPQTMIPRGLSRMHISSLIATALINLGMLIFLLYISEWIFFPPGYVGFSTLSNKILWSSLALSTIAGLLIVIFQTQIPGYLQKKQEQSVRSLLDKIGKGDQGI